MARRRRRRKFTLRQAREYKGLHISEAAELLGVHYNTLRRWEIGEFKPNTDDLKKLCEIYDMDLDELKL